MEQIDLRPEDTLYVLGDVMDRYPDGVQILQELMAMPNAKLLLGNHEYMMLQVMDPETICGMDDVEQYKALPRWYRNGGEVTKKALEALPEEAREAIISFVRNLPLSFEVEIRGQVFRLIHAAPLALYSRYRWNYRSGTEFAVWYRWPIEEPLPFDTRAFYVSGHTPTCLYDLRKSPQEIYFRRNRIGIDCGAGFDDDETPRGRLACLRLDDLKEFYSEESY